MKTPALVIVEVIGGCVQAVYCDCNVAVVVADFDNHEVGNSLCFPCVNQRLIDADKEILRSKPVRAVLKKKP